MKKFINIISALLIIIFFFLTTNHYFSSPHIKMIQTKRNDLEKLNINANNFLPIIENNTEGVIEFNTGYSNKENSNLKRNFWDLFKN